MNTIFRDPLGKQWESLSDNILRERILSGDEGYWCAGSGEGCLETCRAGHKLALTMTLKEPYGFLLQYGEYDSTNDMIAVSSADYSKTTDVLVGGNAWRVPVAFFVSRAQAWDAAAEFISSGQMSPSVRWVRLDEQVWDST